MTTVTTTSAVVTSTPTTVPVTTSTIVPASPTPDPTIPAPAADAFSDGWFHDRSAIPQVVLWALVVSAIAIGAHVLRRLSRRRLVGIAVGSVPFLIALYFFYQNVNRLLPPSL